jgi:hypothetical protein
VLSLPNCFDRPIDTYPKPGFDKRKNMEILTAIPFHPDKHTLLQKNRLKPGSRHAVDFEQLLEKALQVARPKAAYKECFIDAKDSGTVTVEGFTFTSHALRKNLDQVERLFPYIVTCGSELDQVPLPPGDMLQAYWLDTIKAAALDAARAALREHLTRKYALEKTSSMNPGSGDQDVWPLPQQRQLFDLLGDVESQIGVVLTDSYLMLPNKTVSGVRFQTEVDFHACQLCHREGCPSRAAPFDRALWDAVQA